MHRVKLVDWLIDVHQHFELRPETLYLTVNIIDRYLSEEIVPINKLQLVGISSLFIASKYEEIYPPELRDFSYITKNKCAKEDILSTEYKILKKLHFNLLTISPLLIFNRLYFLSAQNKNDFLSTQFDQVFYLANYLMELCLLEYKMLRYPSSIIASAALFCSRKIVHLKPSWPNDEIIKQVNLDQQVILECFKEMTLLIKKEKLSSIKTLRGKYSKDSCKNIYEKCFGKQTSGLKKFEGSYK